MMPELPFGGLSRYGQAFLGRFSASFFPEPNVPSLTQLVTFVDTPGVLSGEKQRVNRSYDFASVSRWFAAAWKSNLQTDFNASVLDGFDASPCALYERTRREKFPRGKIGQIGFDVTEIERSEVRSGPPNPNPPF